MAGTTNDIFGTRPRTEPAAQGTYGEPPSGYRLPETTRLGTVRLQVADLERSIAFYQDVIGLRLQKRSPGQATLAVHSDAQTLIELIERHGVRPAPRGRRLGLYHYAILLPDRPSLGRFARHLAKSGVSAGSADHLVSEAFYLYDPDGLGIEVYADRPRSSWQRIGRELMLATDPLDMRGAVSAADDRPWTCMPEATSIGHVHLHVGDLSQAAAFFSEALGFDRMTWSYPGALFLGAGGYHHHLGTNTWAGARATSAAADEAQLLEWTIQLPDGDALAAAAQSLSKSAYPATLVNAGNLSTYDPWGTAIRLTVDEASSG